MEKIIGKEVKGLQNMMARYIERLSVDAGGARVSGSNLFMLRFIMENQGTDIFQRDLEKVLETTKSTCSKVISTMESKGLIKRVGVADARYKKICLTPLGEEVLAEAERHISALEEALRQGLSEEQLQTFFDCIDVMKSNLSKVI